MLFGESQSRIVLSLRRRHLHGRETGRAAPLSGLHQHVLFRAEKADKAAAERGLAFVEIALLEPGKVDTAHTRALLEKHGIGAVCSLGLPDDARPTSRRSRHHTTSGNPRHVPPCPHRHRADRPRRADRSTATRSGHVRSRLPLDGVAPSPTRWAVESVPRDQSCRGRHFATTAARQALHSSHALQGGPG